MPIKKEDIWPQPDYKNLYENGADRRALLYQKMARDAIPMKPQKMDDQTAQDYAELVKGIKNIAEKADTADDIVLNAIYQFLQKNEYLKKTGKSTYNLLEKGKNIGIKPKLINVPDTKDWIDYTIRSKRFLYSEEEKALSYYNIFQFDENCQYDEEKGIITRMNDDTRLLRVYDAPFIENPEQGTWFVADSRNNKILVAGCDEQAAKNISLQAYRKMLTDRAAKIRESREKREATDRMFPNNAGHVSADDFLNTLKIKDVQFEKSMKKWERQEVLDNCYKALKDLTRALKIDTKEAGLQGKLSLTFGARNVGPSYIGNYDAASRTINLSKDSSGALAHEWIHALCFITRENEEIKEAQRALLNSLKYNEDGNLTNYYLESKRMDDAVRKEKPSHRNYYSNDEELLARAGDAWIFDRLQNANIQSDWLTDWDSLNSQNYPIPRGDESEKADDAFDNFLNTLKAKQVLKEREPLKLKTVTFVPKEEKKQTDTQTQHSSTQLNM